MDARLVLFDIDGTLIDTAGAGRRAMEQAFLDVFEVADVADRAAEVRFAGMTDPLILEAVGHAAGIDGARFSARRAELERRFLTALERELERPDPRRRVLPGVKPLLDELERHEKVHLGLLTGNLETGARIKLGSFGLNGYFPGGGFASDHRDRREIARVARQKLSALSRIEFPAGRVVVVGDTEHDVDCAKANRFRSVAVDSGWVPRDRLEAAGPDVLLDDLSDRAATLTALGVD